MSTMIKTEKLSFTYPAEDGGQQETSALREVDLEIKKGSFVTILGHNGSGKSTLAKHMNAVLLPTGGKVWVEGMDTANPVLLLEIRRRIGMVFQNPDNQIVANVVEEDVAFAPENLGVPAHIHIEGQDGIFLLRPEIGFKIKKGKHLNGRLRRIASEDRHGSDNRGKHLNGIKLIQIFHKARIIKIRRRAFKPLGKFP